MLVLLILMRDPILMRQSLGHLVRIQGRAGLYMLVKHVRGYVISTLIAKGMSFSQSSSVVWLMRVVGLLVVIGGVLVCELVSSLIIVAVSDVYDDVAIGMVGVMVCVVFVMLDG